MKKITYKEMIKKNAGASNECKHCGKLVAFEPISSLYYAEHDKEVFTFCTARCRTIATHSANADHARIENSKKMGIPPIAPPETC